MVLLNLYQHILIRICTIFFSDFYINTLSYICSTISNKFLVLDTLYDLTFEKYSSDNNVHSFCLVSNVDIYNLIITLKSSSLLDPLPNSLFNNMASFLTPFISTVVNSSLRTGKIPDILKHEVFIPLLKKYNIDKEILTNYRPISQLYFINKIIDIKIVAKHLNNYLLHFNILDPKLSGFRKFHSTETTLISLTDYIIWTLDHNKNIQLLLLDLSSAFNTIKHDLLIYRFKMTGLSDNVLLWFISYLQNRYFSIKINNEYSSKKLLNNGVPRVGVCRNHKLFPRVVCFILLTLIFLPY